MANYFSKFPKIFYSLDNYKSSDYVTNITRRFSLENKLKENTSLYYTYDIRDGDTPEIIASKLYDSPERHWIVLMMNDIVDPQTEWPLDYYTLHQYIDAKYLASANSNIAGDGLNWARTEIKKYFKIERQTLPNEIINTKRFEIDANTYANTQVVLGNNITLDDGMVVVYDTDKNTQSFYDYEFEKNEEKRKINLLKREFVKQLEEELDRNFL